MICLPVSKEQAPQVALSRDRPFWTWKKVALIAATILAVTAAVGFATGCLPIPVVIGCAAGSVGLFTGVAVAVLIEKIKKRRVEPLTPELLTFLMRGPSLGLRCVPARDGRTRFKQAEYEMEHGVWGDSLNLNPSDPDVWNGFFPEDQPDVNGRTQLDKFKLNPDWVPAATKKRVIARWEKGVDHFIRFQIDSHQGSPVFLLVVYPGTPHAYDLLRYGLGLGKTGSKNIPPANIKALLSPPIDASLTKEERVRHYRSWLIRELTAFLVTK